MKQVDVLVVGAGFGGLYAIHRLKALGLEFVAIERGDDIGGVWNWNRYPGARCDVESLEYSYSFSEELQQEWSWSERYAGRAEILRYLDHVAERFDLRRHISLNTEMKSADYDKASGRWTVTLDPGGQLSARFVILATGTLTTPNVPNLPGLARFKGRVLHTARWPKEGADLSGLRIGFVGAGSTAAQALPMLAREAAHLTAFQRTPNYAAPARNAALDPATEAEWKANYPKYREIARNSHAGIVYQANPMSALEEDPEARRARLEQHWAVGGFRIMSSYNDLMTNPQSNELVAEFFREKTRARITDPEVARKLIPTTYPAGGKRLCIEDDYFEAFNRDNVDLVALREEPIVSVTEDAIETSKRRVPVDAIVFATGFDAITGSVSGVRIQGEGPEALYDFWRRNGPASYLGHSVAGFPNLFLVSGPGNPIGRSNAVPTIEHNVEYITQLIDYMKQNDLKSLQATANSQAEWMAEVAALADRTLYMKTPSWYNGANIEGKSGAFLIYLGGFPAFRAKCAAEAEAGYPGYALERQPALAG